MLAGHGTESDASDAVAGLAERFVNETNEPLFLTGKAGTGKTTFLKRILKTTHKAAAVAAPTGVAAINAGGVTLHSLFQLPLEPHVPGYEPTGQKFKMGKNKINLLRRLELLVIDEVSMLRADTLDAIDQTLRRVRRDGQPFGGLQVVYIGDLFQLPPVVKEEEWELLKPHYPGPFFFHAHALRARPPLYLELTHVYRQSEQRFIDLLNKVRDNRLVPTALAALNTRCVRGFVPPPGERYITLTTHNYKADRINRFDLDRLPGGDRVYTGTLQGDFPESSLPNERELRLRVGAQVMFIRNDPEAVRYSESGKPGDELRRIFAESRRAYWRGRLTGYFEWKPLTDALWELDRLLDTRASPEFEGIRMLADAARAASRELAGVAETFRAQLGRLADEAGRTGDLSVLKKRCAKGVAYFHGQVFGRILRPLAECGSGLVVVPNTDAFRKALRDIVGAIETFLEGMGQVRYNNVPLAEGLELPRLAEAEPERRGGGKAREPRKPRERTAALPKGETARFSLALFQSGKTVEQVAAERQLSVSTVEGHLANYIGAEVPVDALFKPGEWDELLALVRPLLNEERVSFKSVYDAAGGRYSYGRLRMAYEFLRRNKA
jgi:hypothetical protein